MIPFTAISYAEPGPRSNVADNIVVATRSTPKPATQQTTKKKRTHRTLVASKKSARKTLNAKDLSGKEKWWLDKSDVGPVQVVVSMEDQHATVYAGGKIVARTNVSTGKRGHTTPTGVFSILQKNRHHRSNIYSNAPMPYMQRLTWSGIALHASKSVPNYPASHGCVRLPNAFAKKLFQFTQKGAHVVIAKTDRSLSSISHPALFQPIQQPAGLVARARLSDLDSASTNSTKETTTFGFQATDGPEGRYPSTPGAANALDIAPMPVTETISVASLRLSRTDADEPLITQAPKKSTKPIRVLITRRTGRELIKDVQRLLNRLSYDAGDEDGYMGSNTGAAIKRFQEAEGLTQTGAMSAELVRGIYEASGKGVPPMGHIYVRQNFRDVLDAPIGIDDPEKALGTHFFTAQKFKTGEDAPWTVMSLDDKPKSSRFSFMTDLEVDPSAMRARVVLDRLQIPDDVRTRISAILTPGSSLAISDNGISTETGKGTDFVVLTR